MERDLNRCELRELLSERFGACGNNLTELARRLNLPDRDYKRFVAALHKYRVHPGRDLG